MKNETLHREDYEAMVFSDLQSDTETFLPEDDETGSSDDLLTLVAEDGLTYTFLPLGMFSVDDSQYLMVRDIQQTENDIHFLLITQENGSDTFHTISEEEFNRVMEDFARFMEHLSSEEEA